MTSYKIEHLSDEEQLIKDVYCHYGLASYIAQCFEQELVIFLSFIDIFELKKDPIESVDYVFKKYQSITCGKLIHALQNAVELSSKTIDLVQAAHKKRNYITHRFFYDKAVSFMSENGRIEMIYELNEARLLFQKAESSLHHHLEPLLKKHGVNQDLLNDAFEKLLKSEQD